MKINVKKTVWFGSYKVLMNESSTSAIIIFGQGSEIFEFEMPYACLEGLHKKIGKLLPELNKTIKEYVRKPKVK